MQYLQVIEFMGHPMLWFFGTKPTLTALVSPTTHWPRYIPEPTPRELMNLIKTNKPLSWVGNWVWQKRKIIQMTMKNS